MTSKDKLLYIIVPILIILTAWAAFLLLYSILKNNSALELYSTYLPLIGETGLDAIAALLAFKLRNQSRETIHKKFFLILAISFIASLIADLTYKIALNIFEFRYEKKALVILFNMPFALFLLLQLIVMAHIIYLNSNLKENKRKTLYISNITLSLSMSLIFIFGMPEKIGYFSTIGLFQLLNISFAAIGFALATICLARFKSKLIYFITTGYFIIVLSDLMIRYFSISGTTLYSNFEAARLLGLMITCVGLYLSLTATEQELLRLMPINSLQSQITLGSLVLWLGALILFIVWNYFFNNHNTHSQILAGFFFIFIPFLSLVIIGSHFLAVKISSRIAQLGNTINQFNMANSSSISSVEKQIGNINSRYYLENRRYEIYEVEQLHHLIMNTVSELELVNRVKTDLLMKMSHDFRTHASGIYSVSRSIYKRIEDPKLKNLQLLIIKSSEQLINLLEGLD
ncbi:hypothetical protein ACQUW5_04320 [Legionella sp. CNM-1927-20]|uniref:hypothetical protein n=1 Tax=Legionella sp. CNM-1927-20 TaxID=3422221 RepID=UPI00403AC6C3